MKWTKCCPNIAFPIGCPAGPVSRRPLLESCMINGSTGRNNCSRALFNPSGKKVLLLLRPPSLERHGPLLQQIRRTPKTWSC